MGLTRPARSGADGAAIRELRIKAGLTVAGLARQAGCHRRTVEYIENGRRGGTEVTIEKIATALGTDRQSLMLPARRAA